jgi:hypothetical protein
MTAANASLLAQINPPVATSAGSPLEAAVSIAPTIAAFPIPCSTTPPTFADEDLENFKKLAAEIEASMK